MGIRFQCPNGHKLNVKTDLAGKRGSCPNCGAKIVVPAESASDSSPENARAAAGDSVPELPAENGAPGRPLVTAAVASPSTALAASVTPAAGSQWYVRPTAGGQFGPATDEVFRDWIADGRVAADAFVWREGWADWKLARDAADDLPAPLVATPVAVAPPDAAPTGSAPPASTTQSIATTAEEPPDAQPVTTPSPPAADDPAVRPVATVEKPSPAARYTARRRRSKKKQVTLAVLMLVAVLVLAVVLVLVLRSNPSPASGAWRQSAIELASDWKWPYVAGFIAPFVRRPQQHG
jgi:hypothetical protein